MGIGDIGKSIGKGIGKTVLEMGKIVATGSSASNKDSLKHDFSSKHGFSRKEEPKGQGNLKAEKSESTSILGPKWNKVITTKDLAYKFKTDKSRAYAGFSGKKLYPEEMKKMVENDLKSAGYYYSSSDKRVVLNALDKKIKDPRTPSRERIELKLKKSFYEKNL